MSNIFTDKKETLGISFRELGNRLKPKTNPGTAHKYLSNPGYWSKKTIIRLCNALDVDHDKGIENWKPLRRKHLDSLVDKKMES